MVRFGRAVLVGVVPLLASLLVAAPARAAQAEVTVSSVYAAAADRLEVYGTATCTEPTGTAHVTVMATQVMPFSFGWVGLDVPCAGGLVYWEASVLGGYGWQNWSQVTVNANLTDSQGGADDFSGVFTA
ncbi:hypothetical protein [Micromonospora cathayae]|uniref:Uncharacterized protein n=1 Tax=Micromonospora cathayae TaxID=3028804 RepID=A0ABY7ZTC9_9ACTN|nr:hypothetical protein [Micromonospora sp. HUAS 3]WDZ86230.1 hypothetical protein PVK37_07430 [Micromonospora sp. HUAS 3]